MNHTLNSLFSLSLLLIVSVCLLTVIITFSERRVNATHHSQLFSKLVVLRQQNLLRLLFWPIGRAMIIYLLLVFWLFNWSKSCSFYVRLIQISVFSGIKIKQAWRLLWLGLVDLLLWLMRDILSTVIQLLLPCGLVIDLSRLVILQDCLKLLSWLILVIRVLIRPLLLLIVRAFGQAVDLEQLHQVLVQDSILNVTLSKHSHDASDLHLCDVSESQLIHPAEEVLSWNCFDILGSVILWDDMNQLWVVKDLGYGPLIVKKLLGKLI